MGKNKDFDWLDDPFNEKKAAQDQLNATTSGGTKIALGCGCVVVVLVVVALLVFTLANIASILA